MSDQARVKTFLQERLITGEPLQNSFARAESCERSYNPDLACRTAAPAGVRLLDRQRQAEYPDLFLCSTRSSSADRCAPSRPLRRLQTPRPVLRLPALFDKAGDP